MPNQKFVVRRSQASAKRSGEFLIGDDLRVTRLGFGAMRITGKGIWGDPASKDQALALVLQWHQYFWTAVQKAAS